MVDKLLRDCQFIRICDLHGMRLFSTIPVWEGVWFDWSPDGIMYLRLIQMRWRFLRKINQMSGVHESTVLVLLLNWEPTAVDHWKRVSLLEIYCAQFAPQKTKESIFQSGAVVRLIGSIDCAERLLEQCYEIFDKEANARQLIDSKITKESELSRYGGGSFVWDNLMGAVYGKWGVQ